MQITAKRPMAFDFYNNSRKLNISYGIVVSLINL